MDKQQEIKKERKKLEVLFQDLPDNKKKLCAGLLDNAAFMRVTLTELQAEVIANGAVISCQSGNGFDTIKDNPAQKAYTTMISRYSVVIDKLMDMLPDGKAENSKLDVFLNE